MSNTDNNAVNQNTTPEPNTTTIPHGIPVTRLPWIAIGLTIGYTAATLGFPTHLTTIAVITMLLVGGAATQTQLNT